MTLRRPAPRALALALATSALSSGCYLSHDRADALDAGPPLDAGLPEAATHAPSALVDALRDAPPSEVAARCDLFVTSREGFSRLRRQYAMSFGIDEAALRVDLRADLPASVADPAAERCGVLARFLLERSPTQRARWREVLGAVRAAPAPYRPVHPALAVLSYPQADIAVQIPGHRQTTLRYADIQPRDGQPRATLLLIHGHASRMEELADLLPHLPRDVRVLIADLPWCGYSEQPVLPQGQLHRPAILDYHAHVLERLVASVPSPPGRVVGAGGSLGGNLALRLGAYWPDRFSRVVAWGPGGAWRSAEFSAGQLEWFQAQPWFGSRSLIAMMKRQGAEWYGPQYPRTQQAIASAVALVEEIYTPRFRAAWFGVAIAQQLHSLFDLAPQIRVPVTLLSGEHDRGNGMQHGVHELARKLGVAAVVVKESGHSIHNEQPAELATHIAAALG